MNVDWNVVSAWIDRTAAVSWTIASSGPMQRLYVVAASLAILVVAMWRARNASKQLDDLTQEFFITKFRGPHPKSEESIYKQNMKKREILRKKSEVVWSYVGELLVLGVILPSVFLLAGTYWYQWFDPYTVTLLSRSASNPIQHPSLWQALEYLTAQLLRGGLFDAIDVFKINITTVTNNPHAYWYSTGLFVYHLYIEAFMLNALIYLWKVLSMTNKALRGISPQIIASAHLNPTPPPV